MRSSPLPHLFGGITILLAPCVGPLRAQTAEVSALALIELSPRPQTRDALPPATGAEEAAVTVRVHPEALAATRPGAHLRLEIAPGVSAVAEVRDVHSTLLGRRVLAGGIIGRPSGHFLLVTDPASGEVAGNLALSAEEHYVLGRAPGGSAELQVRRAPARLAPAGPPIDDAVTPPMPLVPAPRPRALPADAGPADAPGQYDLLIVYTAVARAAAGGTAAVELLCELATESCNQAYANSGLALRARLVCTMESAFVETGSYVNDLAKVASGTLVGASDVASVRDQYGADFVSLFVGGEGAAQDSALAGLGYQNARPDPAYAFTICNARFVSGRTMVHELGHNMGCAHDLANAVGFGAPAFPFSYGWRWTGADGVLYRDVMAYAPGTPEMIFSSPLITFAGGVAGDPLQADNARTLRDNAPAFCNHRRATVGERPLVSLAVAQREALKETGQPARLVLTRTGTDLTQALPVRLVVPAVSANDPGDLVEPAYFSYFTRERAVAGLDFTAPPQVVTIPAGSVRTEVLFAPIADPARRRPRDVPEVVAVALLPGDGYDLGAPVRATLFVYEHAQGVTLSAPVPRALQNPPQAAQVVLRRTGPEGIAVASDLPLAVQAYAFGGAREGVDYAITPRLYSPVPTIAAGAESLTFSVTALPGAILPPGGKTLTFALDGGNGANAYHYDPFQQVAVTLLPTAPAVPPAVVSLTASATRVVEGGGTLKLLFARAAGGDLNVDLTVAYQVSGAGSARLAALPGTVVIPAGAARVKVKLRAADDGVAEGDQKVKVALMPGEGYTVGSPAKVKLAVGDLVP